MIIRINAPAAPIVRSIAAKIRLAEKRLEDKGLLGQIHEDGLKTYWTSAPNRGIYNSSPLLDLNLFLEANDFKGGTACDLGAGLGGAAAVMSLYFEKVEAWEADGPLHEGSVRIWKEAEDPFNKINFQRGDFLSKDIDLGKFSFIYFYKPFMDGFRELIAEKLLTAKKGAVIACLYHELLHNKYRHYVFPFTEFREYPLRSNKNVSFSVFERT